MRALDQGDGMAGPLFNLAFSILIHNAMACYPLAHWVLIHDDFTMVAPMAIAPDDPSRIVASATESSIQIYIAEALDHLAAHLLTHGDLILEITKLHLLHLASPAQPSLSLALSAHFPPGITVELTHYVVGGLAVGSDEGILLFLAALSARYAATIS